ncbi:hypothetical protein SKAU_G00377040 [Synaphobranchus kaupii]|uniref:Doublecortin domain-containing protein n=1 Tax=Synaphobranchus kaupii TaxID=118154 RepID=A0A9Q1ECW4_SYNKA|nr:hypothetical protein SKAU_G00377040 [Synaphobranchus kaupii]
MSDADPPQRNETMGRRPTVASWQPVPSDPLAPKRVCFYKSGDPQFSGFRAVISGRTFKSFDALLDGLSKKVPLPFGVRNITTPRGTHAVLSLEELEDGKSYLCSDRKKAKPIDLQAAGKRPVPWNSALPATRGRHAAQPVAGRVKRGSSVALRMPRTLTVFRNGDPSARRTIMLQSASSQSFETLLGHVSEVMQFPVVKLYTTDGRRVDGLVAFHLCSTVVAAKGHEPFRPIGYSLQKPPQSSQSASHLEPHRLQPKPRKSNSLSTKNSRNFSPSPETFLANQMNDSVSGSLVNPHCSSTVDTGALACARNTGVSAAGSDVLVPPDVDDIEKSCRINQDGSMTVEMKVRLMIKEEEVIHWTTTLSRSSTTCWPGEGTASQEPTGRGSLTSNINPSDAPDDNTGWGGTKVWLRMPVCGARHPDGEAEDGDAVPADVEKPRIRRVQTPGPRVPRKKQPPAESIQTVSDREEQENVVGASYSYMEQIAGSTVVEKCSIRPTPKPRSAAAANRSELHAAAANRSELHAAFRSSRSADVLQIESNGREVTESVLHVYEQQSCFDSYIGNAKIGSERQSVRRAVHSRTFSTDTAPCSSGNDNGRLHERPSVTSESPRESDSTLEAAVPSHRIRNNNEGRVTMETPSEFSPQETDCSESRGLCRGKKKSSEKLKVKKKASPLSLNPGGTLAEGAMGDVRGRGHEKSTSDIRHDREADEIRAEGGAEHEPGKLSKMKKKKKGIRDRDEISQSPALLLNIKHLRESTKELNLTEGKSTGEAKLNISTFAKKNLLDIQPLVRKMLVKQRSMTEEIGGGRERDEISESASMPILHSSPSAVNEYVENWLEKMQPQDITSCEEDASGAETEAKVQFQIGSDSREETEAMCDIKSAQEECPTCGHITDPLSSHAPTERSFQLGPECESHVRKNTSQSKSHICIKPMVEVPNVKKWAEALVQSGAEMPLVSAAAQEPKIKPSMEQLCSSIQSISQISHQMHPPSFEKFHSVPDFSAQVAAIFGSSSKMLIAFLSAMSLKEGIASLGRDQPSVKDSSGSEALQMVKALHKLAGMENTEELKTSLSDLYRSASSELLQSWRSFQDLSSHDDSQEGFWASEHPTLSEANLEESSNKEGYPYGFQELVKGLGISDDLQRELFRLVMGEMMNDVNRNEEPTEKSEEANSFVELETKEDYFVEPVQGIGVNAFAQSVVEDGITNFVESTEEELPAEAILEEKDHDSASAQEKEEVNNLEESVLVEGDDDFAQSAQDMSRNDAPNISVDEDSEQCKHSTLVEANYLQERRSHTGESVISAVQEKEASYMQRKACFLQMGRVSEAFQLSSTGQSKEVESMMDDAEDRVRIAKLQTGSVEREDPSTAAISRSVEIPEDLLDYVRSVLMSSSLVFSYDSRGNLRIEPESSCGRSVKDVPQYGQKQLPSPAVSELSDYRETSESDRCSSRSSMELITESEGDGSGVQPITWGSVDRLEGGNDTDLEESEKAEEYHTGSLSSDPDGRTEERGGVSRGRSPECASPPMYDDDMSDGVLIDKGRWLLKENHLIRKSPPVPCGMYGNAETTSADSGRDDVSDDIPCCSQPGTHRSPMAVLSSSELEDLAGPVMPKCSYFNMSHGSDSEPFQDELSDGSRRGIIRNMSGNGKATRTKKELGVPLSHERSETWPKKGGSLSSFASVELKMGDNKVHPQAGPSGSAHVESQPGKASNTTSQTLKEQDSLEKLHLVCGQHCPIL